MFIPIDAKSDITGSKKGKLTPAQHAQLNAWCLAEKTGILDCLDKCEATAMFYSATNNIATVVFKKGYLVICGRFVECEAGTEVQLETPVSGTENGWIVAKYDLSATQEKEFEIVQKKATEGGLVQEDLNQNPLTGRYELPLYSYIATANGVTLIKRLQDYVPDIGGKLTLFEKSLTDEGKPLGGYDTSKGTIEERLTSLGFKEATITDVNSNYVSSIVAYQQGKVVAVKIEVKGTYSSGLSGIVGKITNIDLSFLTDRVYLGVVTSSSGIGGGGVIYYSANYYYLNKDGTITVTSANAAGKDTNGFVKKIIHIEGKSDDYTMTVIQ